jgi:hypothetical protein
MKPWRGGRAVNEAEELVSLNESSPPSSEPPSRISISPGRLAAQLLDEGDRAFVDALREAGLLAELDPDELLRVATVVSEPDAERRRVTMLELYYEAAGNAESAARRRRADRFFLQRLGEPATAAGLVSRLAELAPELPSVRLERIGGGDGPLVLRAGDHMAAVLDEYEEETDTDEFDLAEAEARRRAPMVTVRGLVRAINVLLDRFGVRERLVNLRGDGEREVYAAVGVTEAVLLGNGGHLEDESPEEVMNLGAW